jgi:mRNA interferase RelE/StbE
MIVLFDKSFSKSIDKIREEKVKERILKIIISVEKAGWLNYYRIKSGDYRIGIELENITTVRFIIISHRKDIYRNFP